MSQRKVKTVRLNYRELDIYARLMHSWLLDTSRNPLTIEVPGYSQEQVEAVFNKIQRVAYMP